MTYAGYGCGCSSETAFQCRRLHPLRRTGLEGYVSVLFLRSACTASFEARCCPSLDTTWPPASRAVQCQHTGMRRRRTVSHVDQRGRVWRRRVEVPSSRAGENVPKDLRFSIGPDIKDALPGCSWRGCCLIACWVCPVGSVSRKGCGYGVESELLVVLVGGWWWRFEGSESG